MSKNQYYYFDKIPEDRDTYTPEQPQAVLMKPLLDAYRNSDVNTKGTHPHYPGRMDQAMRGEEERAAIPKGYTLIFYKF